MKIKLFTRINCPKCPAAKLVVDDVKKQKNAVVEIFDVDTVDGMAEAAFYTVMSTPTVLVCDTNDKEISSWRGEAPKLDDLLNKLN